MDSTLLANIHKVSVLLFLIIYLFKTIFLFSNTRALEKFSKIVKVPEMIISTLFLATGIWLLVIVGGIKFFQILKLVFILIAIPMAVSGFKKQKKGLALLSMILIIGAYGLAEMSKNKPYIPAKVIVTAENQADPLVEGARVYLANCAFCHGEKGDKGYRGAINLKNSGFDHGLLEQIIREGSKGKMPAYQNDLSATEISAVATFVKSLRNGQ